MMWTCLSNQPAKPSIFISGRTVRLRTEGTSTPVVHHCFNGTHTAEPFYWCNCSFSIYCTRHIFDVFSNEIVSLILGAESLLHLSFRVIGLLIAKGYMELEETVKQWKQKTHLLRILEVSLVDINDVDYLTSQFICNEILILYLLVLILA